MKRDVSDVGASVRARLLNRSRETGEDFQFLLSRFVNERFLHRLSVSAHADRFILKGATLFAIWSATPHRATRDVDLLGFGDPGVDSICAVIDDLLTAEPSVDDGVRFDLDSLSAGLIRADQEYGGVRARFTAVVARARVQVQIDVGFGDAVTPAPVHEALPALLDFPAPVLRSYPRETVVAEKLEAMVRLGLLNSRMKDFHDLAVLARSFAFDGAVLADAVRATFERRGTPIPDDVPVALTDEFARDDAKQRQWTAFVRKTRATGITTLADAIATIRPFVSPVLDAAGRSGPTSSSGRWESGRGWDTPTG